MKLNKHDPQTDMELDMTPMIDVVFLLIIFFMIITDLTQQDLEVLISEGRFREDLYYRLKVVTVHLPPLRERPQDLPLLIDYFIKEFAREEEAEVVLLLDVSGSMAAKLPGAIRLTAALATVALLVLNGVFSGFGEMQLRISPFFNPAALPNADSADLIAWTVQNRIGFLLVIPVIAALAFGRAERRESMLK